MPAYQVDHADSYCANPSCDRQPAHGRRSCCPPCALIGALYGRATTRHADACGQWTLGGGRA